MPQGARNQFTATPTNCQLPVAKLADYKRGPYNPLLPTLRHYARDSMMHRLPDRHCRTTTPLSNKDFVFSREGGVPFMAPHRIHCHHITDTGRRLADNYNDPKAIEIDEKRFQKEFCTPSAEAARSAPVLHCTPPAPLPDVNIDGYVVRYFRPETRDWNVRYTPLQRRACVDKDKCPADNDFRSDLAQEKREETKISTFDSWEPYRGRKRDLPHWRSDIGF